MSKKKALLAMLACIVMVCSFSLAGCGSSSDSEDADKSETVKNPVKVTCENGVMLGKNENGVTSFKGVPYAKQPTGDLRWKAPQAAEASDEEIECYEFGHTALQYEWPTEPASYYEKGEDCLTLNIWESKGTPDSDEAKPVMVFFHGGAYAWGGTTDPMYDGQNFIEANDDVILITCNYRLGLMAWADFSQVEGGEDYTDLNLAIRDHIAALQWIQDNISAFGGDPDNVTIFGESAGGFSTTALCISPMAQGLFNRAISESGVVPIDDREEAQKFADYIMEASGAKNMDDLLDISAEEWVELDGTEWIGDECCGPVADGEVIPYEEDIDDAMATAAANGIELLIGANGDEWNYFKEDMEGDTDKEKFDAWVSDSLNPLWKGTYKDCDEDGKAAMDEFYDYASDQVAEEYASKKKVKDALTKSAFVTETWRYEIFDYADSFAEAGGKVYAYFWDVPSTLDEMYKSAVHAVELAYVFNNLDEDIYAGEVDADTAARTQEAWTNFATSGDPSIEGAEWLQYDTSVRNTMVMQKDKWETKADPTKTERQLMERIYGDEPKLLW